MTYFLASGNDFPTNDIEFFLSLHRYKEFIKKSEYCFFCIYNKNVKRKIKHVSEGFRNAVSFRK